MTEGTCSIEDCDGKATRRGWCTKHYQRWRRHGDPLIFRPDATRGCSVADCDRPHYARTWCTVHYERWLKTGDPSAKRPHFSPLSGRLGDLNPAWVGDDAGYNAVHKRLRDEAAPSEFPCAHCGGDAQEWAYDHGDPNEKVSREGLAYSTAGRRHYLPLCRPCHKNFDNAERQAAARVD